MHWLWRALLASPVGRIVVGGGFIALGLSMYHDTYTDSEGTHRSGAQTYAPFVIGLGIVLIVYNIFSIVRSARKRRARAALPSPEQPVQVAQPVPYLRQPVPQSQHPAPPGPYPPQAGQVPWQAGPAQPTSYPDQPRQPDF